MNLPRLLAAAAACLLSLAASAQTGRVPAELAALADQARKEGEVVFFTGTARYPRTAAAKLEEAFQKQYGFPMKVTFAAIGPHPTVVQQLRSEASSGVKPAADLFPTALSLSKILREAGAVEAVDWVKLGAPADVAVPSENAVLINVIARNVVYNTNLVKAADAPRRLEDLADPKWRGKIVAPAIGDAFAMMVPVLGEEKATQLVKQLVAEQKIALVQTITDVATKVASGEYAIGFGVPADWTGTRTKGAPIANAPLAKVSGQPFYASVLKNAQHPAAAKLLGVFICCTREGQQALNDALGWSKFEMAGTESFEIGGQGRGVYPTVDFQLNHQRRVASDLGKLLAP
jgi:ABC-type Fe3+ transport system substrate-binding protein